MKKKICYRLKESRQAKGLKQKDMAVKLGISRAGYSRMETGKVELTTKNLLKLAKILEISLDWLILGKEADQTTKQDLFSLFGKYAGAVEAMFTDMKENETMLHGVLSFFFERKGKEALEHQKKQEKEQEKEENV